MNQVRPRADVDGPSLDESGRAAVKWMVALTSGTMTECQLREFDRWRNASPANALAWERMSGGLQPFDTLARSGLPRGSLSRMRPVVQRDRRALLAGLAGLIAVGGAGTIAAQRFVPLEDLLSDHYTKTAELERFYLGDDSEIVLAPRSSINVAMTSEVRSLELVHGKMMLDIVANDPRPFVIDIGRVRLDASAGLFVLNRRDDRVTVSSLKGTGMLRSDNGRRLAIAERERLALHGSDIVRSAIDVDVTSSWVSGFSVVRDEPIAGIVEELRPYYAGFIRLSPDAGERRATGVFNLFDPVSSLSALTQSVGLKMTRTAGFWITIHSLDA